MQKQEVMLKISIGSCGKQGAKCKKTVNIAICVFGPRRL